MKKGAFKKLVSAGITAVMAVSSVPAIKCTCDPRSSCSRS